VLSRVPSVKGGERERRDAVPGRACMVYCKKIYIYICDFYGSGLTERCDWEVAGWGGCPQARLCPLPGAARREPGGRAVISPVNSSAVNWGTAPRASGLKVKS